MNSIFIFKGQNETSPSYLGYKKNTVKTLKAAHQREDEQNHHKEMEKLPALQNSEGRVNILKKKKKSQAEEGLVSH